MSSVDLSATPGSAPRGGVGHPGQVDSFGAGPDHPGDDQRHRLADRDRLLAFKPGVEQVDDVVRQRGKVGDGLVLDLAAVAVGAAQVRRGLVSAAALLVDVPGLGDSDYMDFPTSSGHNQIIAP
jgi:hypothetical protein